MDRGKVVPRPGKSCPSTGEKLSPDRGKVVTKIYKSQEVRYTDGLGARIRTIPILPLQEQRLSRPGRQGAVEQGQQQQRRRQEQALQQVPTCGGESKNMEEERHCRLRCERQPTRPVQAMQGEEACRPAVACSEAEELHVPRVHEEEPQAEGK